jgi:GH24 family phage-related lysozyme (muramidase)/8-oxo-dGTP pyrophosphatase MutT (NUDIX family)
VKSLRNYIRTVLNEASINDKGELVDFNAKTQYPHKKIGKFIKDYIDTNYEDWAKMGWTVFDSDYDSDNYESDTNTFWRAERIDDPEEWDVPVLVTLDSDEEAARKARDVGFSVDEDGIITGLWGINMVDSLQESERPIKRVAGALVNNLLREGSYDKPVKYGKDIVDRIREINPLIDKELDNSIFSKSDKVYCKGGAARLALLIFCDIDNNGGLHGSDVIRDSDFVYIGGYNRSVDIGEVEFIDSYDKYFSSRDITLNEVLLSPTELIFTRRAYRDGKKEVINPSKSSNIEGKYKVVDGRLLARMFLFASRYGYKPVATLKYEYDENDTYINFDILVCLLKAYELGIEDKYFRMFKEYCGNFNFNDFGSWLASLITINFDFFGREDLLVHDLSKINDSEIGDYLDEYFYKHYPDLKKKVNRLQLDDSDFNEYLTKPNRGESNASMRRTTPNMALAESIRRLLREDFGYRGINMVDSLQESERPIKRVAGALIKDEESGDVLLIKRNDKNPKWAMATGKIDEGEDSLEALEREIYEELFIKPGQIRLNFKGLESFPAQNMELYYYEGFVRGKFKPHLDEENLDYGWFSIDKLPSPLIGGLYNKIEQIQTNTMKYSDTKQIAEVRKQVRLIMEQKVMPKFYLQEAVRLIKEGEEKSPTFYWDLTDKGVKDDISPTFSWDLSKDKPVLDSYDQAKEYIDKALSYIKDKASALEFVKDLKEYIQELSTASKIKLTKYVATALLGIIGFSSLSNLMSNSSSDVEKEVISSIDKEMTVGTYKEKGVQANTEKRQQVKNRPNSVSAEFIDSLKESEALSTIFYDIDDGAYTVGWGHAVFKDPSRGSTGGDYDFVPKYEDITPGVTKITVAQAEQLLKADLDDARKKLDAVLDEYKVTIDIDQNMYDAMVSMVYNMGAGEKFKQSEFFSALKKGNVVKAYYKIDDIDSAALLQKYPGLKERRAKEKERFGRDLSINTKSKEINNLS